METTHSSALHLQDALLFFGVAALLVPLLRSLRIHTVLAFLLAGVALGPYGLGALAIQYSWLGPFVIKDVAGATALAEIGVVLLLFLIGLELSWERLWNLRQWIFGLGTAQLLICGALIGFIAWKFGNSPAASIVLGGCLALSSTAIVMQLINEQRGLGSSVGLASFSILLLQDLAVVPLFLLTGLLSSNTEGGLLIPIIQAFGKALAAIVIIALLGRLFLRPLFRLVISAGKSSEVFMALTLLVAIGSAGLTEHFGLSMALGSFMAGVLLAETQYRHEIEVKLESFHGLLMGLFFMSVGMNINLAFLMERPLLLFISIPGLMLLKSSVIFCLLKLYRFSFPDALYGGLLLSQAGEFGFIVVGMAMGLQLLDQHTGQFMLFVISCSMLLTPLVTSLANRLRHFLEKKKPMTHADEVSIPLQHHVLIAGCGRVGQLIAEVLTQYEQPWLAVEQSPMRTDELRDKGFPVIYGDVSNAELMSKLHVDRACAVVVTVDQPLASEKVVQAIRNHCPNTPIFARAKDMEHAKKLLALGATKVIPEAFEAGLQLAASTLESMGVPEESAQHLLQKHRDKVLNALK